MTVHGILVLSLSRVDGVCVPIGRGGYFCFCVMPCVRGIGHVLKNMYLSRLLYFNWWLPLVCATCGLGAHLSCRMSG